MTVEHRRACGLVLPLVAMTVALGAMVLALFAPASCPQGLSTYSLPVMPSPPSPRSRPVGAMVPPGASVSVTSSAMSKALETCARTESRALRYEVRALLVSRRGGRRAR